jgi:hypothetical protein
MKLPRFLTKLFSSSTQPQPEPTVPSFSESALKRARDELIHDLYQAEDNIGRLTRVLLNHFGPDKASDFKTALADEIIQNMRDYPYDHIYDWRNALANVESSVPELGAAYAHAHKIVQLKADHNQQIINNFLEHISGGSGSGPL